MYQPPTDIIKRVGLYLGTTMPDTLPKLKTHLIGLEATRYQLAATTADWGRMLAEKKNQMLYPQEKGKTELDRKIMLDASVAVIQRDYDFLTKLEQLVEQRIQLGTLLLTLFKNPI